MVENETTIDSRGIGLGWTRSYYRRCLLTFGPRIPRLFFLFAFSDLVALASVEGAVVSLVFFRSDV